MPDTDGSHTKRGTWPERRTSVHWLLEPRAHYDEYELFILRYEFYPNRPTESWGLGNDGRTWVQYPQGGVLPEPTLCIPGQLGSLLRRMPEEHRAGIADEIRGLVGDLMAKVNFDVKQATEVQRWEMSG